MLTTGALSDAVTGRVVLAQDDAWDAARQAFNLAVDQRPMAVAFPTDDRDVASVVDLARERGLRVAAQATGHNAGPLGSLDDTILVNTSELTGFEIDAARRRVRVGAATKWGDVIEPLSQVGLAALHGSSPDVSVVGYSVGGGMGWLARKHGLQANSVTAVELVTADGRLVRADHATEPDLFWALRGGGGNFGVITAMEFAVYPVEQLYAGVMLFEFERAAEVLHTWTESLPAMPDELTSWASLLHVPDLPFAPEPLRGRSFAVVLAAFLGDEAYGRALLANIRDLGPVLDTFAATSPAALAEMAMDPPDPLPYLSGHSLVEQLAPSTIDRLVAAADRSSQLVMVQLRHTDGALGRVHADSGAQPQLPGTVATFALGVVPDRETTAAVTTSLDAVDGILDRHRLGRYLSFVEKPADAHEFYDPATWARLRRVKADYDPSDIFKGNHHVPPAADLK